MLLKLSLVLTLAIAFGQEEIGNRQSLGDLVKEINANAVSSASILAQNYGLLQNCDDGKGKCVPPKLCKKNIWGGGTFTLRGNGECEQYLERCCPLSK